MLYCGSTFQTKLFKYRVNTIFFVDLMLILYERKFNASMCTYVMILQSFL